MRIVSLLPAATEWVCVFGAADTLVGRSHACYEAPELQAVPRLTRPAFPTEAAASQVLPSVEVDLERLRALEPDLVLMQAHDTTCAASQRPLDEALMGWPRPPRLFPIAPRTFKQVLSMALRLGKAIGRMEAAMEWVGEAEMKLRRLRDRLGLSKRSDSSAWPAVACLARIDPLVTMGYWVPDLLDMAGGQGVLTGAGEGAIPITWEAVQEANPDVLVIAPCNITLPASRRDVSALIERPGWEALKAVRRGKVYFFDGRVHFNHPGPRLYRTIELLTTVLHPEAMGHADVEEGEVQRLA